MWNFCETVRMDVQIFIFSTIHKDKQFLLWCDHAQSLKGEEIIQFQRKAYILIV